MEDGPGHRETQLEMVEQARALRLGANFEWLDPAPKTVITGRVELDFEGDFTRVDNRNVSSIRSSQPSLRLAWARIDRRFNDKVTGFTLGSSAYDEGLVAELPPGFPSEEISMWQPTMKEEGAEFTDGGSGCFDSNLVTPVMKLTAALNAPKVGTPGMFVGLKNSELWKRSRA